LPVHISSDGAPYHAESELYKRGGLSEPHGESDSRTGNLSFSVNCTCAHVAFCPQRQLQLLRVTLRLKPGLNTPTHGGVPCQRLPRPLGAGFSKNSTAGDAAFRKLIAPALAVSSKDTCFHYCCCKRSAANVAITAATSGARFPQSEAIGVNASNPRVKHQPIRSLMAALHSACGPAYTDCV
jgi:hypothetical protein